MSHEIPLRERMARVEEQTLAAVREMNLRSEWKENELRKQTKMILGICKNQARDRKKQTDHETRDEHRFTVLETAHKKDKIDRWLTKAAMVAGAAILHFLHLK